MARNVNYVTVVVSSKYAPAVYKNGWSPVANVFISFLSCVRIYRRRIYARARRNFFSHFWLTCIATFVSYAPERSADRSLSFSVSFPPCSTSGGIGVRFLPPRRTCRSRYVRVPRLRIVFSSLFRLAAPSFSLWRFVLRRRCSPVPTTSPTQAAPRG